MTEPTQSWFDEKLTRFAGGDVTPEEVRELARASLESPAWFEELTATALAKTAVSSVPLPAEPLRRAWWRSPFSLAAAATVVVGVAVVPYLARTSQRRGEPAGIASSQSAITGTPLPTLAFTPGSAQPILLAQDLQFTAPARAMQVFRGEEQGSRSPRQIGAILSVEDGLATISLGSADGLMKGSEIDIYRDSSLKDRVGTLRVETVFREQARGDVGGNEYKTQYAARVADRDHLQARLQQADDFESRGDLTAARRTAVHASEWANSARLTPSQRARATELLGRLDFQAKNLAGAETHYRAALDLLSTDPHASPDDLGEVQNNLAALAMVLGEYDSVRKLLETGTAVLSNQTLKADRLNNLGVLAETRGDRKQAESFYLQALTILPRDSDNERKVVEVNLDRVKGLR